MNIETIAERMRLSFADTPFPVVVGKLAGAGVAACTADLTALRKTYYDASAGSHDEAMPLADPPAIAAAFDAAAVEALRPRHPEKADRLRGISAPDHAGGLRPLQRLLRRAESHVFRPRGRLLHRAVPDGAEVNSEIIHGRLG